MRDDGVEAVPDIGEGEGGEGEGGVGEERGGESGMEAWVGVEELC